jgi:hypothetical protein
MEIMKKTLLSIVLVLGLTTQSHAFFGTLIESMTSVANNMIDSGESVINNGVDTSSETVLGLSDDIGEMADRIGDMADRIVQTEQLLADLTNDIANGRSTTTSSSGGTSTPVYEGSNVLLTTEYGLEVAHDEEPNITYNNDDDEYLLYISTTMKFNSNATSFLIRSNSDLRRVWGQIVSTFSDGAKLFIAIKTIDGNDISNLSNAVLINIQRAVPQFFRTVSISLGGTRWQTIRRTVLPQATPGIITGVILGLERAAGETAPILFTGAAFFLPRLPSSPFDATMALPYHLFVISTQVPEMPIQIQYGTALVLLVFVLGMNMLATYIRGQARAKRQW